MTTLGDLADRYVSGRRQRGELTEGSARHMTTNLRGLAESFGNRSLDQLTKAAIERWQAAGGELAPSTRRHRLSAVRSFCRWLVEQHLIRRDPTVGIPSIRQPRSVPRALPGEAVTRLLGMAPDARAGAVVWLMVGLGLRCLEVAGLEVADYDPAARTVLVTGKYHNQRLLPMPSEAQVALDGYLLVAGHIAGPLIRSYKRPSSGLRADTIGAMVAVWMRSAGVKARAHDGVSAHALRHTAASDVLDRSHDLRIVQEMLGHARLATTAIYLRRADSAKLREAMEGRAYDGPIVPPVELPPPSLF